MKNALIVLCYIGVWIYAIPFACLAQARAPESSLQVTPAVTRLLIDSIGKSLCRNYIFPDSALKMTKYVEEEFKRGAYAAITDPKKLADQLQQDLQKAHQDGHLRIFYDPRFARDLSDTTDRSNRQRQGDAEGLYLKMPVYILTSRQTFSAAEDFTYGMQSVKRAIIVGDTTGGGAHPVRPFPIGQGFVASIPFARSLNPYTQTDWEGTGVIPDIPVASNKACEAAQIAILTERMNKATSDIDKRRTQWRINELLAGQIEEIKDAASLSSYTGTYQGGLVFYVSQSMLYCKNAERGNQVFKLSFVSGNRFILDENVQIEFTKDNQGNFSNITMYWRDGGVSNKSRIN